MDGPITELSVLNYGLVFLMIFQAIAVTSAPAYTPTDNIALNCGSSGKSVAPDHREWTGDIDSKFAHLRQSNNKSETAAALRQGSVALFPYMTARLSQSEFTYTIQASSGPKFIRLHFYPAAYPGFDRYKSFFSVKVGPYTLLKDFNASLTSDHLGEASFMKEFCVHVKDDQSLSITFAPSSSFLNESYAFINGLEITSMPENLYYSELDGHGIDIIGQVAKFYVESSFALETTYRLNVGGRFIAPPADTGMYRTWDEDLYYLLTGGVVPSNRSISLMYTKIPAYTAPDDVYRTARSMGSNRTENMLYNLTWALPVDSGFWYLIRLHFCEFDPLVEKINDRRFRIYIDNQTADPAFSVIEMSGGNGIPVYNDYVVMIGKRENESQYTLFVALHPIEIYSAYADAILNGLEVFKLSNSDGNLAGPNPEILQTPPPEQLIYPSGKKSNTKRKFLIAATGSVIGLLIILCLLCYMVILRWRKRKNYGFRDESSWCWCLLDPDKGKSSGTKASSLPKELCQRFSLAEIKDATNNFDERLIIGEGGFGNVYKGYMDDGRMTVAIKRLNPESKQGADEFKTEIEMLSQLRHVHLVSLIGYCDDEQEMILVYDYMINGTLRDHLYSTDKDPLPWKQRLEICRGAATGLHYLHTGHKSTIIHRDVKTTNILLDEKWDAKVSDFGLSKMDPESIMVTRVKGTWGYLDPEYARGHPLTEKSDVYSFGVVLFEVLCARKAVDRKLEEDQVNLANWARKCIDNGTLYQIIDPYLMGRIAPESFKAFVEIAESCIRQEGIKRPSMHDVMETIGFALELQKSADAEKERIGPGEDHYNYPEMIFPVARCDVDDSGSELSSSISNNGGELTVVDSDATGRTYPTLCSSSFATSNVFSGTNNSKSNKPEN